MMVGDLERAERIGEFWSYSQSRTFAETADRLRGGPDASGGAGRDAAQAQEMDRRRPPPLRRDAGGMVWHPVEALPSPMVEYVEHVLSAIAEGVAYSEWRS